MATQPNFSKNWLMVSAVLLFFGVMLGAFGAHGLEKMIAPDRFIKASEWWQTATQYLFVHALGLFGVAILMAFDWCKKSVAMCLLVGTLIFSGSLYLMAIGFPAWLGAITPIGGTLMMGGWGLLAIQLLKK